MVILLVILSFFIRAYPRIKLTNVYASDTYFHLYCAKSIKENNYNIPSVLPRVLLPHRYTYPYLYHYVLSLFSDKWRLIIERYTGAVTDTLSMIVFYVYSIEVASYKQWSNNGFSGIFIVMLLYLMSPALLRIGSGPRAYNGSPRTVGQLLYIIHMLSYYTYSESGSVWQLAISILAGSLIIITGKFSTQVLIFFGVVFAIFYTHTYWIAVIVCVLLSVLISKGKSIRILAGQLEHTILYAKYFQARFLYPHITSFKQYRETARRVLSNRSYKDCVEWLLIVEKYPLHLFITLYPHIIIFSIILLNGISLSTFDKFLLIWSISGLVLFAVTKIKQLLFLGEGERYVEYSLFPSLYLFVKYALTFKAAFVWILVIYYIYCALIYLSYFVQYYKTQNDNWSNTAKCYLELDNQPSGILWPIGSFHFQALMRSQKHLVLSHGANVEKQTMDDFNIIYKNYPYPSGCFADIVRTYGVNYIISDEQHIRHYMKNIINDPDEFDSMTELLTESPLLKIWKIRSTVTA